LLECTATVPLAKETFILKGSDPRHVLFENQGNGQYLRAQVEATSPIVRCCDRTMSEQESFFEIQRQ
jgi:hypothetical protein